MADFNQAIEIVLRNEDPDLSGTVECVPGDSGGRTRFGIAEASNPDMPAGFFAGMPHEQALAAAIERYRRAYAAPLHIDAIADQRVATKLLDLGVNLGVAVAIELLQEAVDDCGLAIAVDGVFGPATLAAANACDPERLHLALDVRAAERYGRIEATHPNDQRFSNGWMRRDERT